MHPIRAAFIALSVFLATSAFATPLKVSLSLRSDYVPGVGRLTIQLEDASPTVWLLLDENACSADGKACTKAMYFGEAVEASVISDARPTDRPLTLGLTDRVRLIVSSGFAPGAAVEYVAEVRANDGSTARVPLQASPLVTY